MDSEEREIFQFLTTWGAAGFVSYREIARRAGGKQKYHKNQDWAKPLLTRMLERGILEKDAQGRYRIKPVRSKDKATRWVAPDIAKILQEKGLKVEGSNIDEVAQEDYYNNL